MSYFIALTETDSLSASDVQLIEGIAPIAFLLFTAGVLSWVVEIINNFRR